MKLVWSAQARQDLEDIIGFIADDDPLAALDLDTHILAMAHKLEIFPKLGKPGLLPETRELVLHRHYLMVYTLREESVYILAVLHTARQWPPD